MRGKLPKSWRFPEGSPLNLTDNKTDAHLYDSAAAIIATTGAKWYDLAYEIVSGTMLSKQVDGSVPFVADFEDATMRGTAKYTKSEAMAAYALGYYLEFNPGTLNGCQIVNTLRDMLQYLQTKRNLIWRQGLISRGQVSGDHSDYLTFTDDNILAYFAFKQAGKVLGEPVYNKIADQLMNAIWSMLWKNNTFLSGIHNMGADLPDVDLETLVYGALFCAERGDFTKAGMLLNQIEGLKTVDSQNGAIGYAYSEATKNTVWFEGSYMVAIAYHKAGNPVKYKQIFSDLEKYRDILVDGGQIGALKKDTWGADFIMYKATGATAWSYMAEQLKAQVFSIRNSVASISGCIPVYWNQRQAQMFTKSDCGPNTTTNLIEYAIEAGYYFSYNNVGEANASALAQVQADGQTYANLHGVCVSTIKVPNDAMCDWFFSNGCAWNQTPIAVQYCVSEGEFEADTKAEANALAQQKLQIVGQANADTQNQCQNNTVYNWIWISTRVEQSWDTQYVYITAWSSQPVNTDIMIRTRTWSEMGAEMLSPALYINTGNTTSGEQWLGQFTIRNNNDGGWQTPQDGYGHTEISEVSPDIYDNMDYEW